jgi:hypothetical protein
MAYIGNGPEINSFTIAVDRFSGTGACTQFTLTRDVDDPLTIEVIVDGVVQTPTTSYTVTNGVMTFDEAPSSGIDNISVRYLAPVVVTFNQVTASQIQPNSVTQTAIASNSVTQLAIAINSVTNEKIANNAVTGEKISSPADIFDDAFLFGGM